MISLLYGYTNKDTSDKYRIKINIGLILMSSKCGLWIKSILVFYFEKDNNDKSTIYTVRDMKLI